jgi:hypothetical protein
MQAAECLIALSRGSFEEGVQDIPTVFAIDSIVEADHLAENLEHDLGIGTCLKNACVQSVDGGEYAFIASRSFERGEKQGELFLGRAPAIVEKANGGLRVHELARRFLDKEKGYRGWWPRSSN